MIKADRQKDGSFIVRLDKADYDILHRIQTAYSFTYDQALLCCIHKGIDRIIEIITASTKKQIDDTAVDDIC